MLRKRRLGIAAVVAGTVVALVGAGGSAESTTLTTVATGTKAAPNRQVTPRTVTLLTGDRVTVVDNGKARVERGKDRAGIVFLTRQIGGHLHVVPSDAVAPLRAGRLDGRLFDVTALLSYGYDRRADLPLIVTGDRGAKALVGEGATVVRELPAIGGRAVRADRTGAFWRALTGDPHAAALRGGVSTVYLDGIRRPTLDQSVPQIGAPAAWAAGFDGRGVTVAVLDTGVDRAHPDLANQVAGGQNFTEGEEDDLDRLGHGTHVASTIVGTGAASGGKYKGVAPGAKVLDGKVCLGGGDCAESWILAGMQWAAEQGASVVNMSLGGLDTPGVDPVEAAVNTLTARYGTLFVVAAGNDGTTAPVGSPASADAALAVGAVTKQDDLADFSSRGPRVGDGAIKPDITGPGVDIVAARSKDGVIGEPGQAYTKLSGTSMATPHVAGAAAILAQKHPDWASDRLKAALMASARPNPALGAFAQGAGRVDVARAIDQTVFTSPVSVSFGRHEWPHGDDTPLTRTIAYRNAGAAPLTLAVAVQTTGPAGQPAPEGMFRLSASTVTVPAGGEASVTLTADTRVAGPDGVYTGRLTATGGSATVVTTPFAVERAVESYNLTLRHLNRAGQLTGRFFTDLVRTDAPGHAEVFDEDGATTVRLPKGRYTLLSHVAEDDRSAATLLAQPRLDLAADRTVAVDARKARPVSVTVPHADAAPLLSEISAQIATADGVSARVSVVGLGGFDGLFSGQLGPAADSPGFTSKVGQIRAKVRPDGTTTDSPFVYNLAWFFDGRLVTGLTRHVTPANLATVKASFARQAPDLGEQVTFSDLPGVFEGGWSTSLSFRLPFERTEYYTSGGAHFMSFFLENVPADPVPDPVGGLRGPAVAYRAGKTYTQRWNGAVFGPSLADPTSPNVWVTRAGDTISIYPPLFSDAASRQGWSLTKSARTTVFRDGEKILDVPKTSAKLDVPGGPATYRVEMRAERAAPHALSTTVDVAWTFRSQHVPGTDPARLPVSVVRFAPPLDAHNAAPSGGAFTIPVSIERQPGAPAAACTKVSVEISYDDGVTWQPVRLTGSGDRWQAHLTHPAGPGFVSLRAAATDTAGNTVTETLIRAYRLGS